MGKITGMEQVQEIPPKVLLLYEAVRQLIGEGENVSDLRVSTITDRAGIGKGTAYDYFDTKEEIIACACIFYIYQLSEELNKKLLSMESFEEQMRFLFDRIGEESGEKYCFARFIHVMMDNSKCSQLMQEKLKESAVGQNFPECFFGRIIAQGQERGQIRRDVPANYLLYSLFCKIFTFMMCLRKAERTDQDVRQMKAYVLEGILGELQESV